MASSLSPQRAPAWGMLHGWRRSLTVLLSISLPCLRQAVKWPSVVPLLHLQSTALVGLISFLWFLIHLHPASVSCRFIPNLLLNFLLQINLPTYWRLHSTWRFGLQQPKQWLWSSRYKNHAPGCAGSKTQARLCIACPQFAKVCTVSPFFGPCFLTII